MTRMPRQESRAKQVPSLGESPAEARARMSAEAAGHEEAIPPRGIAEAPQGQEVEGPLTPQHIAEIEAKEGGFQGEAVSGGITEERGDREELPSPSKAMDMIRQLSNDKIQLQTERDAALYQVERYRALYGDLD
jgi:hypothetical protein